MSARTCSTPSSANLEPTSRSAGWSRLQTAVPRRPAWTLTAEASCAASGACHIPNKTAATPIHPAAPNRVHPSGNCTTTQLSDAGVDKGGPIEGLRELAADLQFGVTQGERGG